MSDHTQRSIISAFVEARHARPTHRAPVETPHRPRLSLADPLSALRPAEVTDIGPSRPLANVITERVSHRSFEPPTLEQIGLLVARAGLARSQSVDQVGMNISHRAAPSAGARHPFELAIAAHNVIGMPSGLWVLDPHAAVLRPTVIKHSQMIDAVAKVTDALRVDTPPPAVVFVVADPCQTLSRYPQGLSLLWREAGALLMLLHLIATDLGLGSCIVGSVGALCHNDTDIDAQIDLGAIAVGMPAR
ncbi:SagB/ThcOx family dehydrogenase [Mycobacteroides abscessus]